LVVSVIAKDGWVVWDIGQVVVIPGVDMISGLLMLTALAG
jgi:hypothetical protein